MKNKTIIVWFRKDLRLHDNPALVEASKNGTVIPIFIWSPEEEVFDQFAEASQWWLHQSLKSLAEQLQQRGLSLILRKGPSLSILKEVIRESNADALYFNERYEPAIHKRDEEIKNGLEAEHVEVKSFHSHTLFEPFSITNKDGKSYKVYTPFWKQFLKMTVSLPLPAPSTIVGPKDHLDSLTVEDLSLLPTHPWHQKFSAYWTPGEPGAIEQLHTFIEDAIKEYKINRDYPAKPNTSLLSPYLAWGEISVKTIWHTLLNLDPNEQIEAFLKQLVWREFSYDLLRQAPNSIDQPIRSEFKAFPWQEDEQLFTAWKKGMTGYPLVDAGMRQLWETGWMHNRVRMITASFLVKHLLIPWTKGANWFMETLVDYDVANNTMGWQWVAGSGADAAPYFRIFNPILQGEKFDIDGEYIRKWVPELAALPTKYVFAPWEASKEILRECGIELGITYPFPLIDHQVCERTSITCLSFY